MVNRFKNNNLQDLVKKKDRVNQDRVAQDDDSRDGTGSVSIDKVDFIGGKGATHSEALRDLPPHLVEEAGHFPELAAELYLAMVQEEQQKAAKEAEKIAEEKAAKGIAPDEDTPEQGPENDLDPQLPFTTPRPGR